MVVVGDEGTWSVVLGGVLMLLIGFMLGGDVCMLVVDVHVWLAGRRSNGLVRARGRGLLCEW